jgi:EAL domain-containing protein (putative c-di-GMP-specific phosphodiesterase class I)
MRRRREVIRAAELREALQQNRFVLYAQPITRVDDPYGKPWRHEVLVRLRTRDNQLLQPGAFIPAAERFGLIADLDRWVIKTALREFAAFGEKHGRGGISINISGASLVDEDLADLVRSELASSGVAPAQVCFEIAETAAVNRLSQAMRFIDALRDLDCGFALDDFGSGLASFNYLKDLPVDCLKVDGSFVRDMATDPVDQATVKAITDISQVLGIQTVAEQVEDSTTVEAAVASGVAFLQGFAVGKPIPLSEIQPH